MLPFTWNQQKKQSLSFKVKELEFSWLGRNLLFNTCIDWSRPSVAQLFLSEHLNPTTSFYCFNGTQEWSKDFGVVKTHSTCLCLRVWVCLPMLMHVNSCTMNLFNWACHCLIPLHLHRQMIIFYGSFENEQKRERFSEHYIYWKRLPLNLRLDSFKENLLLRNGILCSL